MSDMLERSARHLMDNPPSEGLSATGIRQRVATRRRRRSAVAGIGCAAVAVAGLGFIVNNRSTPGTASAPVETLPAASTGEPAAPVAFVFPELPAELTLVLANEPAVRNEPSTYQVRLFGALDDPGDPARMIRVEYSRRDGMALPCYSTLSLSQADGSITPGVDAWVQGSIPISDSTPFTAGVAQAAYCNSDSGLLQAGWFSDNVGISLQAGNLVSPAQLVQFAQTITEVPPELPSESRPSVDLVSDPLPADLTVLVGEDVPFAQQIVESAWTASVGGQDDSPSKLNVQTWTGVDEQGIYDRQSPIEAERIVIRGYDGYRYVSEATKNGVPAEVEIWWSETPGVVVSVWSSNLYTADQLTTLVGQLEPADPATYEAFGKD